MNRIIHLSLLFKDTPQPTTRGPATRTKSSIVPQTSRFRSTPSQNAVCCFALACSTPSSISASCWVLFESDGACSCMGMTMLTGAASEGFRSSLAMVGGGFKFLDNRDCSLRSISSCASWSNDVLSSSSSLDSPPPSPRLMSRSSKWSSSSPCVAIFYSEVWVDGKINLLSIRSSKGFGLGRVPRKSSKDDDATTIYWCA
mmetsp:Transcript_231/g.703  ORF Transcript_231/g.703 Transcript_231/m.703 type:complete len:200 (+) Transcript_231:215-814(+)